MSFQTSLTWPGSRGYFQGMNRKAALKILGIREGVSLVQAKKAFRHLAKQYHPDRFAKDDAQAEAHTHQMKQINQAFAFLAPLLAEETPEEVSLAGPSLPRERKPPPVFSFSDFLEELGKGLDSLFRGKPGAGQRSSVKHPAAERQNIRRQPFHYQAPRFEKILHKLHPGSAVAFGRNRRLGKDHRVQPYANFIKHMALKKNMAAHIQRHDRQTSGRIEKISPVSRVNPPGEENKF